MVMRFLKETPEQARKSNLQVAGEAVGGLVVGKLLVIKALVPLVIGAAFLTVAWETYENQSALSEAAQRLDRAVEGRITEAWWHLDLDTEQMADAVNWQAVAQPSLCVRVAYDRDRAESPATAVFCRYWQSYPENGTLAGLSDLGSDAAVPFRDESGQPELAIRLSSRAHDWMQQNPAWDRYLFSMDAEPTALEAFEAAQDRPAEMLLRAWSQSDRIALKVSSDQPGEALPAELVRNPSPFSFQDEPVLLFSGLMGLMAWSMGWMVMFLGRSRRALPVIVITLGLLPWWGTWIDKGLNLMWPEASLAMAFIRGDIAGEARLVQAPPDTRPEAGSVDRTWTLQTSEYAPLYQGLNLSAPPEPLNPDAALQALWGSVSQQLAALPDEARLERFRQLESFERRHRRSEGGLVFMQAAIEQSVDSSRPEPVRRAAGDFIEARLANMDLISSYRPAPEVRVRQVLGLVDHPHNGVRLRAAHVLEGARREWQGRGWPFPQPE